MAAAAMRALRCVNRAGDERYGKFHRGKFP